MLTSGNTFGTQSSFFIEIVQEFTIAMSFSSVFHRIITLALNSVRQTTCNVIVIFFHLPFFKNLKIWLEFHILRNEQKFNLSSRWFLVREL